MESSFHKIFIDGFTRNEETIEIKKWSEVSEWGRWGLLMEEWRLMESSKVENFKIYNTFMRKTHESGYQFKHWDDVVLSEVAVSDACHF